MTDGDRTACFAGLTELASVFSRRLEANVYASYFDALKDFPLPAVLRALKEAVKHCEHFPRPAEIRKNVRTYEPPTPERRYDRPQLPEPPSNPEHAKEAFALIHKIMRKQLTRDERLAEFKRMAAKYPGLGWEAAVDELDTVPF